MWNDLKNKFQKLCVWISKPRFPMWAGLVIAVALIFVFALYHDWIGKLFNGLGYAEKEKFFRDVVIGFGAALTFIFTWWRLSNSSKEIAAKEKDAQTNQNRLTSESFVKAIELLSKTNDENKPAIEARKGGIYALEKIALVNDDYIESIQNILVDYIRTNAQVTAYRRKKDELRFIGQDVKTAFKVLKTLSGKAPFIIDFSFADFHFLDFRGIDLSFKSTLILNGANLKTTILYDANLVGVKLIAADLQGARLDKAKLQGAILIDAKLQGTNLSEAKLQGAVLCYTRLRGADLSKAKVSYTDFSRVDFETQANWEQLKTEIQNQKFEVDQEIKHLVPIDVISNRNTIKPKDEEMADKIIYSADQRDFAGINKAADQVFVKGLMDLVTKEWEKTSDSEDDNEYQNIARLQITQRLIERAKDKSYESYKTTYQHVLLKALQQAHAEGKLPKELPPEYLNELKPSQS